ncbi:MAG: methylmalonyl Co-A mutase-associated GTPase MeaB [Bacteroidota bacterium]|jgi:LAO/AO transport system kinase
MYSTNEIKQGVIDGNFLLLAKAISFVENDAEGSDIFLQNLLPENVPVIGITGPPGAGKSTLISALIGSWIQSNKKVAILSIDPSSPFHKGAILGDRIRMKDWYLHPNVFIRSLASRGHLGGLNHNIVELTTLLQSVGFDYIIVETVGVGQSEVDVAALADTTVVVLVPEAGDAVQMMKSGLLEIADIFVVNKSDRPDAETFANHIREMVADNVKESIAPAVISTVASQQLGIDELIIALEKHHHLKDKSGRLLQLRMNKLVQLILAHKMKSMNMDSLKNELSSSIGDPHFNLFSYFQKIIKNE